MPELDIELETEYRERALVIKKCDSGCETITEGVMSDIFTAINNYGFIQHPELNAQELHRS